MRDDLVARLRGHRRGAGGETVTWVIEVNGGLHGPFKSSGAAAAWALKELPMAPWKIVRVQKP